MRSAGPLGKPVRGAEDTSERSGGPLGYQREEQTILVSGAEDH